MLGLALPVAAFVQAGTGAIAVYRLGNWPAPFGIALVVDRLSALMLLLTWVIALPIMWYAAQGWDSHGRHFHSLFLLQLMGLSGAFVTNDVFNLFVFFEVLLIASYVLLVHGQGRERFQSAVHYVVLNLMASALFLVGLALLYAATGTLNMTDIARRIGLLAAEERTLLQVSAMILLVVFGLKAAVVPLYMWLPRTYAVASAPVAALFAIMTKVGVYSIVRVHSVTLAELEAPAMDYLFGAAMLTCVLGALGAVSARSLGRLVAYLTVASVGTILTAVAMATEATLSAALYYTVHSTLATAALFLLVEMVAAQRGDVGDVMRPSQAVQQPLKLGLLLLLAAASMAGFPPLPGFLGKLLLLEAALEGYAGFAWVWGVLIFAAILTLIGLSRAGSLLFWNVLPSTQSDTTLGGHSWRVSSAVFALLALSVALAVWAEPMMRYTQATASQLQDARAYQEGVLGVDALETTKPYHGGVGDIVAPKASPSSTGGAHD